MSSIEYMNFVFSSKCHYLNICRNDICNMFGTALKWNISANASTRKYNTKRYSSLSLRFFWRTTVIIEQFLQGAILKSTHYKIPSRLQCEKRASVVYFIEILSIHWNLRKDHRYFNFIHACPREINANNNIN